MKVTRHTAALTLSIPLAVKAEMNKHNGVNWSKMASEMFSLHMQGSSYVEELRRVRKENERLKAIISGAISLLSDGSQ